MARNHARYSPSSLDRLGKCCRFLFAESDSMNDAASEGELLHRAVETGDLKGLDDYQKSDAQKCIDYLGCLRSGCGEGFREFKEAKVVLHDLTFGHADNIIVDPANKVIHISDLKFVRIEGEHEFQVTCYGAAAFEMLKGVGIDGYMCEGIEEIRTHIIAPRLGKPVEVTVYNATELHARVRQRLEKLYELINNPFNPPTPDADVCRLCARAAKCPAITHSVVTLSPSFGLPLPTTFDVGALVSPTDRATAQQLAGALEAWCEQIKKLNCEFVQQGGEIPGFKMVNRSTGFKIPRESTLAAAAILQEKLGLEVSDVLSAASLSIPELAKSMAETQGGKEQDLKAQLVDALREVGMQGSCSFLTKAGKAKK